MKKFIQTKIHLESLPLDSPPMMTIDTEIIHTENQDQENGLDSPNLSTSDTEEASLRLSLGGSNAEPVICRDFVRRTCNRALCRYAHLVIPSQLKGIFTFCWNFQNTTCTYNACKYIHATVFEEQEFYRTGIFPPHLTLPEAPPEIQNASAPPRSNSNMLQEMTSTSNRAWNTIDPFTTTPRDLPNIELYTNNCNNCDDMDIRLQHNKDKLESMQSQTKELQLKTQSLYKKTRELYTLLFEVIKQEAATVDGMNNLAAKLSPCGEKQMEVLQKILENNRTHESNFIT